MSDVSISTLTSAIEINPYHTIMLEAYEKTIAEFKQIIKSDAAEIYRLIHDSDYFLEEYNCILDLADHEKLESFKRQLGRTISCGQKTASLITPFHGQTTHFMCKNPGCKNCGRYKAIDRLNYPHNIFRYIMFDNREQAIEQLRDIQLTIKEAGWNWITVVLSPFHNGTYMLRLSNLRPHDMNPLIDDNEVKESVKLIDEIYPYFDTAKDISTQDTRERTYMTGSGITFTTTELYRAKKEGRDGKDTKELGMRGGLEFNLETNQIEYISKTERKKKQDQQDKDEGIVAKENIRGVNLRGVEKEKAITTLQRALKDNSDMPDIPIYGADDVNTVRHITVNIVNDWRENLEYAGVPQPNIFVLAVITQEHLDKFNSLLGVPDRIIPSNIREIEFDDEMLGNAGPVLGLRAQHQVRNNREMYEIQKTVLSRSMTFRELAEKIIDDIFNKKLA